MIGEVIGSLKDRFTNSCYYEEDKGDGILAVKEILPQIVSFWKGKKFLVGDQICWVDFLFFETIQEIKY